VIAPRPCLARLRSTIRCTSTTQSNSPSTGEWRTNWSCSHRIDGAAARKLRGFYREDNGKSDPGFRSLYDFPTNDPTTRHWECLNYPGDIRFLGDPNGICRSIDHTREGIRQLSVPFGLNLGLGFNVSSGKPLTREPQSNTNYQNGGEIPTAPRGSGIQTVDGFKTRTPVQSQFDFPGGYDLKIGGAAASRCWRISSISSTNRRFSTTTIDRNHLRRRAPTPTPG